LVIAAIDAPVIPFSWRERTRCEKRRPEGFGNQLLIVATLTGCNSGGICTGWREVPVPHESTSNTEQRHSKSSIRGKNAQWSASVVLELGSGHKTHLRYFARCRVGEAPSNR
jgi:hypothetical protein